LLSYTFNQPHHSAFKVFQSKLNQVQSVISSIVQVQVVHLQSSLSVDIELSNLLFQVVFKLVLSVKSFISKSLAPWSQVFVQVAVHHQVAKFQSVKAVLNSAVVQVIQTILVWSQVFVQL
jgi:hypothetical protein